MATIFCFGIPGPRASAYGQDHPAVTAFFQNVQCRFPYFFGRATNAYFKWIHIAH